MKKVMIASVAIIASLAACHSNAKPAKQEQAIGMANPASVFCVEQGGKSEVKKDAQGNEYGVCRLPNGKVVDEWEYFRSNGKSAEQEQEKAIGMANPASAFCVEKGGKSVIKKDAKGNEKGLCRLPNGKVVDEWKYFRAHSKK